MKNRSADFSAKRFRSTMIFPPKSDLAFVGIGTDWRNIPGTILGILAGIQSWRVSLRKADEKKLKNKDKAEP